MQHVAPPSDALEKLLLLDCVVCIAAMQASVWLILVLCIHDHTDMPHLQ